MFVLTFKEPLLETITLTRVTREFLTKIALRDLCLMDTMYYKVFYFETTQTVKFMSILHFLGEDKDQENRFETIYSNDFFISKSSCSNFFTNVSRASYPYIIPSYPLPKGSSGVVMSIFETETFGKLNQFSRNSFDMPKSCSVIQA